MNYETGCLQGRVGPTAESCRAVSAAVLLALWNSPYVRWAAVSLLCTALAVVVEYPV